MMKENKNGKKRVDGYELLRSGTVPVSVIREYWKGSPWRAFLGVQRSI